MEKQFHQINSKISFIQFLAQIQVGSQQVEKFFVQHQKFYFLATHRKSN